MMRIFVLLTVSFIGISTASNGQNKLTAYHAADNRIQYTGRIEVTDSFQLKTSAPGAYLHFKFSGTECRLKINDENKWNKYGNYLQVIIDDSISYKIKLAPEDNELILAKGLPEGVHTITICKATEAGIGSVIFKEIQVAKLLPPDAKPVRKMEFVGNSITAGLGNDISIMPCSAGDWYEQANAWIAYGPITARALDTQWHVTAVSGIGLIQSCCGNAHTMPEIFGKTNLEPTGPAWDFKKYQPDVLTICLGQNDGIQDSSIFVTAYIRFIESIRQYYPKTEIILLSSPMADNRLRAMLTNYCMAVKEKLNRTGDKRIHTFFFDKQYTAGCDSHPSECEHQEIAQLLTGFIKTTMNW